MNSLTIVTGAPLRARPPAPAIRYLRQADELVRRVAPLGAASLLILFAVWAWFASRALPLQFDELLELSASNAPTSAGVVAALAAGVDYNPPLSHLLIRATDALFGDAEWALRLPAFLGFTLLLASLYLFVSRQLGKAYGLIAMLLIVCLPVRAYAIQARPYGIVLGFSGLALLLYRRATRPRRALALAGLAVCTASLVGSHYYAVLVVGVLCAAGLARAFVTGRPDWPLLISIVAPPMLVLGLLHNVIREQKSQLTHYFARGSLLSFDHGYDDFAMDPLVGCVGLLLGMGLLVICLSGADKRLSLNAIRNIRPDMIVLATGFLALPLIGAVLTQFVTHAYLTRYFVPASIGLALCVCYALRTAAGALPGLVLIAILSLGMGFGKAMLQEAHHARPLMPSLSVLEPEGTPLVFDTPEEYLQVYHYFPLMRHKIWIIADPSAALRYRHYDTDDRIMLALSGRGGAQAISLRTAARQWPVFRLVPRSADSVWALRCVMEAESRVAIRNAFGTSNFIFEVGIAAQNLPYIEACGRQ